jgi:hypothetical protein
MAETPDERAARVAEAARDYAEAARAVGPLDEAEAILLATVADLIGKLVRALERGAGGKI